MTGEFCRIYKSQLRGNIEGYQRKSFITFNEGDYQDGSRKPIEILKQFSEHYLTGKRKLELMSESDSFILVPIEDELEVKHPDFLWNVAPQEVMLLSSHDRISIENKHASETSRFYTFRIQIPHMGPAFHSFELSGRNQLVPLVESPEMSLKMGVFDGRKEGKLSMPERKNSFVSIVNGAFEVQHRLLERNDSLLIGNHAEIEFEALTEHAIILILSF